VIVLLSDSCRSFPLSDHLCRTTTLRILLSQHRKLASYFLVLLVLSLSINVLIIKKLIFILLLVPCLLIEGFGQSFNLDRETSTEAHWATWNDNSKPDTSRLNAIHNYIWIKHLFVQPDSAFILANDQIEFASLKGNKNGVADGLNLQGISLAVRGNSKEAIEYYESSLTIYLELDNASGVIKTYSNLGTAYKALGDNFNALKYLNKGLVLAEETRNSERKKSILNNLGNVYTDLNELDKALKFYQQAFELNTDDPVIRINIGMIYSRQKKFEEANKTYDEALKIATETNNLRSIAIIQRNKGDLYLNTKDTTAALINFKKSLKNYEKLGNIEGSVIPLVSIGEIFNNRGFIDSAEIYSVKAFERVDKSHSMESFVGALGFRYKILKHKGEHEQALQLYEMMIGARDSLKNDNVKQEVLRQEYKYKYDKQMLAESNSRLVERYIILFGIIILTILVGFIFKVRYSRQLEERSQLLHEIELLKERGLVKMLSTKEKDTPNTVLDRTKIQAVINGKLNDSDWSILNIIYEDPILVTSGIAESVALSPAGVKSSFNKMYKLFNISDSKNKKLALIMRVVELSSK